MKKLQTKRRATECVVVVSNGVTLRGESVEANPAGTAYLRVCDSRGREIAYWTADEFTENAIEVCGALLGALYEGKVLE